jgi:GNAT superfamily N-acetyltransferase
MSLEFVPFSKEHWDRAAVLLSSMHRANRGREPRLPACYEDAASACEVIEKTCAAGSGIVAIRDGQVVGYVSAVLEVDHAMERIVVVLPSGAAIASGEAAELYREMYAAAAERWVANGYFTHFVHVAARDSEAVRAWFSLGFGRYSLYNWRDLSPVAGPEAEIVIRRVGPETLDDEWPLRDGLRRYNASSPILHPLIWRQGAELTRTIEAERASMADEKNAYFLAYQGDKAVAVMIFEPPQPDYILTPDGSAYLSIAFVDDAARAGGVGAAIVNRGFAWAREQGYTLCTVGYYSPNLLGARFWQGKGFQPLGFCLERRLDERIAWAKGEVV